MIKTRLVDDEHIDETEPSVENQLIQLFHARKNARTRVERDSIDNEITAKAINIPLPKFREIFKNAGFKLNSKYTPHQGNRERLRRLARIYHSHPHDCPCKSCEMMDGMLKSRGMME